MMAAGLRRELIEVMISVYGDPLAKVVVRRFVAALTPAPAPRTVGRPAIETYVRGGGYAALASRQVERWAADQLNGMDPQQADLVCKSAAASSDGTVDGTLRQLVAELARRQGLR